VAVDRLERLVNLVAALIDTDRPLTRQQIHERIEGYSDDPGAFRRNFERDKELLRDMGLPLETVADPGRPDDAGYRIPRDRYELPDPGLDDAELAALRLAASAVQVEGAWGREATTRALRKLAGSVTGAAGPGPSALGGGVDPGAGPTDARTAVGPGSTGLALLPGGDAVAVAFGAVGERRILRFEYHGEKREVEPWRLSFRRGQWYLSGWDRVRGGERRFRLDRIEGDLVAGDAPGAFERPPAAGGAPPPPWRLGDEEEVVAELRVDAIQAGWALDELGEAAVTTRRPDGSIVFAVPVTNRAAFRSFVLGFLDHAEILGPPELRVGMVRWLRSIAGSSPGAEPGVSRG
jgi:predicted DNA-binding transcriptional regulator YafY